MDIGSAVTNRGFCSFNTIVFDFEDPFNNEFNEFESLCSSNIAEIMVCGIKMRMHTSKAKSH